MVRQTAENQPLELTAIMQTLPAGKKRAAAAALRGSVVKTAVLRGGVSATTASTARKACHLRSETTSILQGGGGGRRPSPTQLYDRSGSTRRENIPTTKTTIRPPRTANCEQYTL